MGSVSLKHRLLGALVLISLGVIFVPMVLDETWDFGRVIQRSNVPSEPKLKFSVTTTGKLKQIVPRTEVEDTVTYVDDEYQDGNAAGKAEESEQSKNPDKPAPTPATNTKAQDMNTHMADAKTARAKQSSPKPRQHAPSPIYRTGGQPAGIAAWAVQLGSFKSRKNALELLERLRKKHFTAYIEAYKTESGTAFRVRVGPELDLEQAKTLKTRLAAELKIEGIIMQH